MQNPTRYNSQSHPIKTYKKSHIKLPVIKNDTISDMKHILVGISNGLDIA